MSPSREYLDRCAGQTGYHVTTLEKVVRLGELAGDIARHPFLGKALLLKGGTALNLCLGTPYRLSVDLDFNYVAHLDREDMLADRPRVEQDIAQLAQRHGYRVQHSADAFAGRKLYLSYTSALGPRERYRSRSELPLSAPHRWRRSPNDVATRRIGAAARARRRTARGHAREVVILRPDESRRRRRTCECLPTIGGTYARPSCPSARSSF